MRPFFLILLLLSLFWFTAAPVEAATCRTVNDQAICIQKIKRSAKYAWEYRVNLSIDGKAQATAVYNCKEKVKTLKDGTRQSFTEADLGNFICQRLGG
ncbi:MAG: hypothetical protein VKJ02_06865 [Snowella sp.]|nr:hypothetical protein [Snowella sp.]